MPGPCVYMFGWVGQVASPPQIFKGRSHHGDAALFHLSRSFPGATMNQTLTGIGITAQVDGNDLVVAHTQGSNFGDAADVHSGQDNGIGAGGYCYLAHPGFLGCALPLRRQVAHLSSSPLPHDLPIRNANGSIPGIQVRIQSLETGKVVTTNLVDIGPEGGLNRGIDLLPAVVFALGLKMDQGLYPVRYRIIGGAKYMETKDQ